jgi:hypothetical protein
VFGFKKSVLGAKPSRFLLGLESLLHLLKMDIKRVFIHLEVLVIHKGSRVLASGVRI